MSDPGRPPPATNPQLALWLSALVVALVTLGVVWLAVAAADDPDQSADPQPEPSTTQPAPTSAAPTTTDVAPTTDTTLESTPPRSTVSPPPSNTTKEPPAVKSQDSAVDAVGPGWEPGDDTYYFDNPGIPAFDGPGKWGCLNMGTSNNLPYHVNCIYDGGTFPTQANGSGGGIFVLNCEAGCDLAEAQAEIEKQSEFPDPVPAGQQYASASETYPEGDHPNMVTLMMATPWSSPKGDKILFVLMNVRPGDVDDVRNMLRSIYDSARS